MNPDAFHVCADWGFIAIVLSITKQTNAFSYHV